MYLLPDNHPLLPSLLIAIKMLWYFHFSYSKECSVLLSPETFLSLLYLAVTWEKSGGGGLEKEDLLT